MWVLKGAAVESGDAMVFRITDGSIKTMGRATRADFIVDAPLVSRVHCRLTADKSGQLVVEDLDSTNGTRLNGERVKRAVARAGDELGIGQVSLTIERHER